MKIVIRLCFVCLASALMSCTPKWWGVFINSTQQAMTVSLVKEQYDAPWKQFALAPQQTHKTSIMLGHADVSDSAGRKLFTASVSMLDPERRYAAPGQNTIYFLVTEKGIYPIPRVYRKNWRDHLPQIIDK